MIVSYCCVFVGSPGASVSNPCMLNTDGVTNLKEKYKCLSMTALMLTLQSVNSTEGMNTICTKDIPSFGILMMLVESAVFTYSSKISHSCSNWLRSGEFESHSIWFTSLSYLLKLSVTPCVLKMGVYSSWITQSKCVLICSDPSL